MTTQVKWGEILLSHSVKKNCGKKKFVDLVGLKMIDDLVFLTYKLPYEMRKFERKKNLFMYEKEF